MSLIIQNKLLLLLILIIAVFFRFIGLNWDSGFHLHPDERFLTMVGIDEKLPGSLTEYLDPNRSLLNPSNITDANGNKKYTFFVYGVFPITLNKVFAILTKNDTYEGFTLTGRVLSAFMDLLVVLLIYKTVSLLERQFSFNKSVKFWSAFFYSITVLPIQLSHFLAVDTFLNTFLFSAFYFSLLYYFKGYTSDPQSKISIKIHKNYYLLLCGIFMGMALASKVTAVFMLPLLLYCVIAPHFSYLFKNKRVNISSLLLHKKNIVIALVSCFIFLIVLYVSLRLTDPYLFEHASFIDPGINKLLIQNLKTLKSWENVTFPPAVQWVHKKPVIFSLINLAVFGTGLPYFFFIITGVIILLLRFRKPLLIVMLLWLLGFFLYQSTQFVKTMRYFILIYPFLAIFAGIGFTYLMNGRNKIIKIACLVLILVWPLSFTSIYLHPHSRVRASEWIYSNIPNQSFILSEYWDDALPLHTSNADGKSYTGEQLHVFEADTNEKLQKIDYLLNYADYYILSSNRAWGSIPTVPEYYPRMTKFYTDLFAGRTKYKKIAEFTSYPSLKYLGIPLTFSDDWSEEAFTVYDHPKVIIFKKE